jgi:Fe(II)/alpha-ketoglutarate-dependent arginine beta-hydroxylase
MMQDSLTLDSGDIDQIKVLVAQLKEKYTTAANETFIENAPFYATSLPERVRRFYHALKYSGAHSGITVMRGFTVEDVPDTPSSWDFEASYQPTFEVDFLSVLVSSYVGHIFGWSTQQKGKIIHDLIPIKDKGNAQTGYGSTSLLEMHTEDSFHPHRGDYVCMFGIKNTHHVPTILATIKDLAISAQDKQTLFEKRFHFEPDESHLDFAQTSIDTSEKHVESLQQAHQTSVLYGNYESPYICYDPFYMRVDNSFAEGEAAMARLTQLIGDNTIDLVLAAGDICIIDNRKVVHGRRPFEPKFDGTDRWLKRMSISTNLRKSVSARSATNSRIIG